MKSLFAAAAVITLGVIAHNKIKADREKLRNQQESSLRAMEEMTRNLQEVDLRNMEEMTRLNIQSHQIHVGSFQ